MKLNVRLTDDMPSINRRAFLSMGVGAVAWACARGEKKTNTGAGALSVLPTAIQLAVGDSRQGFATFRGQKPFVPDDLEARLAAPNSKARAIQVQRQSIRFGVGGEEDHEHPEGTEVTDIFTFHEGFDAPGVWVIEVTADGRRAKGAFQVFTRKQVPSPLVGEPAIASESPTVSDPRGVDPICTRTPPCSMHEMTIAQGLAASKPLVVAFATPRYCVSRTCGPVVDIVEEQKKRFENDASFVHVEVWRNSDVVNKPDGDAPTFAEWKLGTEPWVYFIDAKGKIRDRWLGAMGPKELRAGVEALVG
jgi:hypothetical protein